ncbi:CHAT domain-containing protein [uncultured Chitinophaga sp.]|uniref:CHAT domain-containing protein n=1 Tax=uncultured Chitinophaga sp. TaxID=339340 RepID=UPI0025ECFCC8|nr:CHAT domain-containing protein [uncultured Chitinophaga sp.]
MKVNSIVVRGLEQTDTVKAAESSEWLELKHSFVVAAAVRGAKDVPTKVPLDDDSVIELIFEDDTVWMCGPDTLDEVFPEVDIKNRSGEDGFELPLGISGTDSERGFLGGAVIKLLNVFSKKKVANVVGQIAEDLERKILNNRSGLYRLDSAFNFQKYEPVVSDKPYFIFLHGTAASMERTFGDLKTKNDGIAWNFLFETYGENVLAFEHESLTKSPLMNALQLVQALPQSATLHLISQSRGGLIGDVICRFCATNDNAVGFTDENIKVLEESGDRNVDLQMIQALRMEFSNKKIKVEKFIRAASPSDGTTLASKRLDNLLNMIFNLIGLGTGLATNPIYMGFRGLIGNVINAKNDVKTLPGLEAQNPNSPFIKIINQVAPNVEVDAPLIVMSGNCKARINLRGLLIIATKLFFGGKNDLVVDTRSMYKTPKRSGAIQVYLDEATDIDHFSYFDNKKTLTAVLEALQAKPDAILVSYNSITENHKFRGALGLEGGQVYREKVSGTKPIAIVLPGIMGTNLSQDDILIWINYWGFVTGQLTRLNITGKNIKPHSLVKTSYLELVKHLEDKHDVVTFAFDWRLQLKECAIAFHEKLKELMAFRQPIKIVAHSMGGVLVRDFIVNFPDTWKTLNDSAGFKLLFLGAPLGGSFRIPSVLFGEDAIINKLNKIDVFHSKKELIDTFSKLPGILSLLPLTQDADNDFADAGVWKKMSDAHGEKNWPLPNDADLKTFKAYRDLAVERMESIDYSNIRYIAGKDKATPAGYRIDQTSNGQQLVFLSTGEGDQSVTWEAGIPKKMIEQDLVYYVNVTHGGLSCDKSLFKGIDDILENGFTNLMSKKRPVVRAAEKLFRSPDLYDFDLSEDGMISTIMGVETSGPTEEVIVQPVEVSVSKGDLRYASFPLLAGHFAGDGILYAEKVINGYLKGALAQRHQLGLYPGKIGTSEMVITSEQGFKGAIIVGLGEINKLTAFQLTQTIEQAASRYLLDINTRGPQGTSPAQKMKEVGISSLVIGCGYGGLPVDESVEAIVRGIANANTKISRLYAGDARVLEFVEFIEQYEDRALSTFYSLRRIENKSDRSLKVAITKPSVQVKRGYRERMIADSTAGWWTRVTVQVQNDFSQGPPVRSLLFTVSTDGARQEQRFLLTSAEIIEQLVDEISEKNSWTAARAKAIFELLIPNDFKELLKKQGNILWILDKTTAAYPWELLQDSMANLAPLCVNGGMIRQLATQDFSPRIAPVANNKALVVADPILRGFLPQLPGALEEGKRVRDVLTNNGYDVIPLLNSSPAEIIETMFSGVYKVIHLAGHGIFNADPSKSSGMVIGNNTFLSTREVGQMSAAPELVVVNCCYLGKTDGQAEEFFRQRYKLAANIGTQLIDGGVKAVIVAGWAVDDAAALEFTQVFYDAMFAGITFGNAIQQARTVVFQKYGYTNTWGAYQCYGDPFYKLVAHSEAQDDTPLSYATEEEAVVDLSNLIYSIDGGTFDRSYVKKRLQRIVTAAYEAGVRPPQIIEKEAFIYSELMEHEDAIIRYKTLVSMENATFSVAAMERYCRVRIEKSLYDFSHPVPGAENNINPVIKDVIEDLNGLLRLGVTVERYMLLGYATAYSALLIQGKTETAKNKKIALYEKAACYYYYAWALRSGDVVNAAAAPWLEMEVLLQLVGDGTRKWGGVVKTKDCTYTLPAIDQAIAYLQTRKKDLGDIEEYKRVAGYNVLNADLDLCMFAVLYPPENLDNAYTDLQETYAKCWLQNGPKSSAYIIEPHIDFLLDALSLNNKKNTVSLRKLVEDMKSKLQKL